jgi:(p)ppGpp synthase/HD superfamily hydrolase
MMSKDYSTENKASFFARLEGQVLPSELVKIQTAYMIAKHAHRAQERKEHGKDGKPLRYFEHVRRVALIVLDERDMKFPVYPEWRWEDVCAALLHDTIEDTVDITAEILEELFGAEVCKLVMSLTKWPGKREYYEDQVKKGGDRSIYLKMCDRLDNLRSLGPEIGAEFAEKKRIETREVWMPGAFNRFCQSPMYNELSDLCGYQNKMRYITWTPPTTRASSTKCGT